MAGYRQEIRRFLEAVKDKKQWANPRLAKAGGVSHTTIGHALKEENTLGFPTISAIAVEAEMEIPLTLLASAGSSKKRASKKHPDDDKRAALANRLITDPEWARQFMAFADDLLAAMGTDDLTQPKSPSDTAKTKSKARSKA